MRTIEIEIATLDHGKTVKEMLNEYQVSNGLQRALKRVINGITLDYEHIRTIDNVKAGQILRINIPNDQKNALPIEGYVPIYFEDRDIIVFDKPANMTIHPVKEHQTDTLANVFAWHLFQKGSASAFRPINRLDRNTSGLAVVALHQFSASKLSGKITKEYIALCHGKTLKMGTINLPLRRKEGFGITREVGDGGESAVTHYETIKSSAENSLVLVRIDTGRLHQIRAHFSHIGHPLLGDDMYGGSIEHINRHALHCSLVKFYHPVTNKLIELKSPLPDDMEKLLNKIF